MQQLYTDVSLFDYVLSAVSLLIVDKSNKINFTLKYVHKFMFILGGLPP